MRSTEDLNTTMKRLEETGDRQREWAHKMGLSLDDGTKAKLLQMKDALPVHTEKNARQDILPTLQSPSGEQNSEV